MRIRRASVKDVNDIVRISENDGYAHSLKRESVKKYLEQGSTYLIAEEDMPIGVIKYGLCEKCFPEIYVLSVKLEFQGRGIGKALMKKVEQDVSKKYDKIRLHVRNWNTKAMTFYLKLGYKPIGIIKNLYEKSDMHVQMIKTLK